MWGEFPNWGLDVTDARGLEIFLPQWLEALERDYSHPSIIGWCPFNETFDLPFEHPRRAQDDEVLRSVYRVTKAFDATRPVIDTSAVSYTHLDVYKRQPIKLSNVRARNPISSGLVSPMVLSTSSSASVLQQQTMCFRGMMILEYTSSAAAKLTTNSTDVYKRQVLNIVLDPVFIFVFDMGVKGAAIATVLSQTVSLSLIHI